MAMKSVYCPDPAVVEGIVRVAGEEHEHLRVSRTATGEAVELFDGLGRVWPGEVVSAHRRETRIRVGAPRHEPAPALEIVLAAALVRQNAFEWMLEKAVEVGVTRIVPFRAERSNVSRSREDRWRRIMLEAAKQSKHYHLARLDPVTSFERVLEVDAPSRIILAEAAGGRLEEALSGAPVLYLVGPEGGWTEGELEAARAAGFGPVHLGPHIMRAETAAVVGAALIANQLGGYS